MADNNDEDVEIPESDKTPVTIITGFLGSGKTTLVNYILKEQTEWKICVVENEFGEVQIDGDLVEENLAAKEDIITMDNGCICCSVRGDLVRTFGMLVAKRRNFDAIIIETTGLADPAPIAFTFSSNAIMQDNYRIDSIVSLVDAKHVNIHLDDVKPDGSINEAENQIAFADRIVLNKVDLVSKEELEDVEDRIKTINSFAQLIRTERSRAPLDQILGLNSFSLEKMIDIDPTIMDPEPDHSHEGHVHDEHCGHGTCGADHVHDEHCGHHVHDEHCGHHVHDEHCGHHVHDEHCGHGAACDHHEGDDADHSHGHEHEVQAQESSHSHSEHDHDHAHEPPKAKKTKKVHNLSLVSSVGFVIEGLFDVALFNAFMSLLLQAKAADLYRTKGILAFADQGDQKFVFQGVHEQINFGPSDKPWPEGEKRLSKMVFIGKNLDYEYLRESLRTCCVNPAEAVVTMHKR